MRIIRKKVIDGKKYLCVAGMNIPYYVETNGDKRKAVVGPLSFTYYRESDGGNAYFMLFGKKISLNDSRKARHYRLRDQLTTEKCKEILLKELPPLIGYVPDIENPHTFCEKVQWLKFNNPDQRIITLGDKYAVKEYVKETVGEKYVLPVLGAWENADDVDFDKLPEKYALKVNWSSGYNIIVKDKSQLDTEWAREKLREWVKPSANSYYDTFNWAYKYMKPVIYAEPYIEQFDGQVYDYKFYFSNGEFIYLLIATDRMGDNTLTFTFFDDKLELLPTQHGGRPVADPPPPMPKNLDEMLRVGKILARDFPFVRVDFYETDEGIYLGEMTFYSGGGTLSFEPKEWDRKMGEKINIEEIKKRGKMYG